MPNDLGDWYRSIPQITRYWFTGTVVLPLLGRFGFVSLMTMILDFDAIFRHFQIWRPFTSVFYYPITPQTGFHYLLNLYFLYSYSTRLESGLYDGRPADYALVLIFSWLVMLVIAFFIGLPLLMEPLVLAVLYIWCQTNKEQIVQFWFGTQFKAMYLPWILLGFNMILRGGGFLEIIGILVGHLYYFLKFRYPADYGGQDYLQTPEFLYKFLPNRRGGFAGFGVPPASRRRDEPPAAGAGGGGHRWGTGNRLGSRLINVTHTHTL